LVSDPLRGYVGEDLFKQASSLGQRLHLRLRYDLPENMIRVLLLVF
jgi:hypothetical protein